MTKRLMRGAVGVIELTKRRGAPQFDLEPLPDNEADLIELWESAKRMAMGPRLRATQVDELFAVCRGAAQDARGEAAAWTLTRSTIPKRQLGSVISQLLEIVDDKESSATVRGHAAEGVGEQLECTSQAALKRTAASRLAGCLADAPPELRFWSAFALGKLRRNSAQRALRRLAEDQTEVPGWGTVGQEAANALESMQRRQFSWLPDI